MMLVPMSKRAVITGAFSYTGAAAAAELLARGWRVHILSNRHGPEPILGDVVLTREDLLGLEQELLLSHESPRGKQSVAEWLRGHGAELGRHYVNDRHRHFGAGKTEPVLDPSQPTWRD